jgi:hypothetical protein
MSVAQLFRFLGGLAVTLYLAAIVHVGVLSVRSATTPEILPFLALVSPSQAGTPGMSSNTNVPRQRKRRSLGNLSPHGSLDREPWIN